MNSYQNPVHVACTAQFVLLTPVGQVAVATAEVKNQGEDLRAASEKCNSVRNKAASWKALAEGAEQTMKELKAMPEWHECKHLHPSVLPEP